MKRNIISDLEIENLKLAAGLVLYGTRYTNLSPALYRKASAFVSQVQDELGQSIQPAKSRQVNFV